MADRKVFRNDSRNQPISPLVWAALEADGYTIDDNPEAGDWYLDGIEAERRRVGDWITETRERLAKLNGRRDKDEWNKGYLAALEDLEKDLAS